MSDILVRSFPPGVDRSKGEEIAIGGTGIVCLTRPPVEATVAFNRPDGDRLPIWTATKIIQPYQKLYLFHPFTDYGTFRLGLLQNGADIAVPEPQPPRLVRIIWPQVAASIAAQYLYLGVINQTPTGFTDGRIIRITRMQFSLDTTTPGPFLFVINAPSQGALGGGTAGVCAYADGRYATNYTPYLATIWNSRAAPIATTGRWSFVLDAAKQTTLTFDCNIVLPPGYNLTVESQTAGACKLYARMDATEEQ